MQVNLHGTPCIPGVFFLLFWSYRKAKFSTNESTKIRHFDSKISKIFWGGGLPSPQTLPPVERGTHPTPLGAFGASIRLAPSALGTALFSTPNRKMALRLCRVIPL